MIKIKITAVVTMKVKQAATQHSKTGSRQPPIDCIW